MAEPVKDWNEETVRKWLASRVVAARRDAARADREGRLGEADHDRAAAEEMVCSLCATHAAVADPALLTTHLNGLLAKEDFRWSGVNDDDKFDRAARSYIKKVLKMVKTNTGFENRLHHQ